MVASATRHCYPSQPKQLIITQLPRGDEYDGFIFHTVSQGAAKGGYFSPSFCFTWAVTSVESVVLI